MQTILSKLVISFSLLLLCSSCASSLHKSGLGASVNVAANVSLDADVVVGEKIEGSATQTFLFKGRFFPGIKLSGPSKYLDNVAGGGVCAAAAYEAITSSGSDVIVNPQYVITHNKDLITSTEECTVTGYKGTITEIK